MTKMLELFDGRRQVTIPTPTPAASIPGKAARKVRTATVTCNSTTWANLDTGLDLTLLAAAGEWIEVGVFGSWANEAVAGYLDVVTLDATPAPVHGVLMAAAPLNTDIPQTWFGPAGAVAPISGSHLYLLQAGDVLAGGIVKLRARYRTATATNKTFNAGTAQPAGMWARVLG